MSEVWAVLLVGVGLAGLASGSTRMSGVRASVWPGLNGCSRGCSR